MSCKACDEFQDSNKTSFYRWQNANVEIRACEAHLAEIFNGLRLLQRLKAVTEDPELYTTLMHFLGAHGE